MNNPQNNDSTDGELLFNDPINDREIHVTYSAINMTQEQIEAKTKEILSNPQVRKAMADFAARKKREWN